MRCFATITFLLKRDARTVQGSDRYSGGWRSTAKCTNCWLAANPRMTLQGMYLLNP